MSRPADIYYGKHPGNAILNPSHHIRYIPMLFTSTLEAAVKADIHPEYATATVKCACGNTWQTRSTIGELHLDICSNCHPFFTGKQKLVDTAGRVERFRQKYAGKSA